VLKLILLLQMLRDMPLDKSFSLDTIVRRTDGLSGSDLKEACRSESTFYGCAENLAECASVTQMLQ
jgi:SpoVK/Ycf46/Vps4 family AAA+-type ATPase